MIDILNSYLVQYNKLSIPGLGTIYLEKIPAQSDFINKQLLPPSYHYRFDKYFDVPDKDFFNFFAAQKEVPDYEAIHLYNEWAQQLANQISPAHEVEWKQVGKLTRDKNGEVVFESVGEVKAYFTPVAATRVIRTNAEHTMIVGDREVSNREMTELLAEETEVTYVEKESWWIYALILAAIACIIIFFHFYKNGMNPAAFGNQEKVDVR